MILIFILLCFSVQYIYSEDWTVHVYTGNERFAGTDSGIHIRLFNLKHGFTSEYELSHSNWLIGHKAFPFKNLFETGEHDRFQISTKSFEPIDKIYVRRDNFPIIRSDWFLDRIVIERNRDSKKYLFQCHCWLRTDESEINIPVSPESRSNEKNNSLKDNEIVVVILIASISIITCFICSIRACCRRQAYLSIQTQQEFLTIETHYTRIPTAPPLPNNTDNSHEDIIHTLPPYSSVTVVIVTTDEPPPYTDLFPD